jgi:hypothetical protein
METPRPAMTPMHDAPRQATTILPVSEAASKPDATTLASTSTAPPRAPADTTPLLTSLRDLERFLEQDRLTAADVVARIGPIEEDRGGSMPMKLRPRVPRLRKASLSRYPDGSIYLFEVAFAPDARPTILELRGIFGTDNLVVPTLHGERESISYPTSMGARWSVAVIADLSCCRDPHSNAEPPPGPCEELNAGSRVETTAFRRDPR